MTLYVGVHSMILITGHAILTPEHRDPGSSPG